MTDGFPEEAPQEKPESSLHFSFWNKCHSTNRFPSFALPVPNMSSLTLTANSTTEDRDTFVAKLLSDSAEVLAKNPGNRCCKYLAEYLKSEEAKKLSNDGERQYTLLICP